MSQSADNWIDRRVMRRKLSFWRIAAVIMALIAGIAGFAYANGGFGQSNSTPHIAKVRIEGTITEDERLLALLKAVGDSDSVKGVILAVDSPGGTTAGGEAIYDAVRVLAAKKPVVAQVGTLAASAGYMIASASDHIVARKTSIVGSIGVLFQYPDVSVLLNNLGVKVEAIKSSPMKAEPNPFNPASEDAKAMIRRMILDSYDWFVSIVDERRPLDRGQVLALADGSVFTGRQALQNKLIDELGGEETALAWVNAKNGGEKLDVIEWKPKSETSPWWLSAKMSSALLHLAGLGNGESAVLSEIIPQHLFSNGLVSVWDVDSGKNGRN